MRFTLGQDPETNEYVVGDTQTMHIILRGPASEFESIIVLVNAANERLSVCGNRVEEIPRDAMSKSIAAQIEAGGVGPPWNEAVRS